MRRLARNRSQRAGEEPPQKRRRPRRRRSIRTQLVILLVVPLVSLIALWGFAANVTLGPAVSKRTIDQALDQIGLPASTVQTMLQLERAQAVVHVGTGGHNGDALQAQQAKTDAAAAEFRRTALTGEIDGDFEQLVNRRLSELAEHLDNLAQLRAAVDRQSLTRLEVVDRYSVMITSAIHLFDSLAVVNDVRIYQSSSRLTNISWAVEFMQRQISLVGAAGIDRGRLTAPERSAFAQWSGAARQNLDAGLGGLSGEIRAPLGEAVQSPAFARYRQLEESVLAARGNRLPAKTIGGFTEVGPGVVETLGNATLESGTRLSAEAEPIGERIVNRLVVAGGVGLLAVLVSLLLSFLFGRRLARELRELRAAAHEMAEKRLPNLVGRLRRGEHVDMDAEDVPLVTGRTAEIGQVADAFTKAQRVAVQSAVGESMLRRGINRVFLNLAWRSQSLLHRQLRMLDGMERRASDPEVLQDLFRLDHLTTRMRRHAEGLVILSGASPGREWTQPARMEDVLRAAISEVEDYERVEVTITEQTALVGDAVADVVHMLAELIENAASFSPPNTEILVRGGTVGNGFAVEIIDRGIGMDPAERARLNDLLANPPEFDLADTERLGLFVVSRLAARRGVRVVLQESPFTGTTAVVVLPRDLVVGALTGPSNGGRRNALPQDEAPRPEAPMAAAPMPDVLRPEAPRPEPLRPDYPPAPVPAERPSPWIAQDTGGGPAETLDAARPILPRRQKLANLAPQLRDTGEAAEAAPSPDAAGQRPADPPARPAEGARNLWDSLQDGWSRGRDDGGENR